MAEHDDADRLLNDLKAEKAERKGLTKKARRVIDQLMAYVDADRLPPELKRAADRQLYALSQARSMAGNQSI